MLIDNIRQMSEDAGTTAVTENGHDNPDYFTISGHPAFTVWHAKTAPGTNEPQWESHPLYIAKEFEGPLRAVMSQPDTGLWRMVMNLKGKSMSLIMNSPLIHNQVIWGKALPQMVAQDGLGVFTFKTYRDGNKVKNDAALSDRAIKGGLVPMGRRGSFQDITSIASGSMGEEGAGEIAPGKSWTAQVLAWALGRTEQQKLAIKQGVDLAGDWWHNKFLWDRVTDLQFGLWKGMSDHWRKEGFPQSTADRMAAYWANLYAGSVPVEAMSRLSRGLLNGALFSRSFHATNIEALKAALIGLPSDLRAQILRDAPAFPGARPGTMRAKARSRPVILDYTIAWTARVLASGALAYGAAVAAYMANKRDNLAGVIVHWPDKLSRQHFGHPDDPVNEPKKGNRVWIGQESDGTNLYSRASRPAIPRGSDGMGHQAG